MKLTGRVRTGWVVAGLGVAVALVVVASFGVPSKNDAKDKARAKSSRAQSADSGAPCPEGMTLLAGGSFKMGSTDGGEDERPQQSVRVSTFCMDTFEVTVESYGACVDSGTCTKAGADTSCNAGKGDRKGHPINCVDHAQATAYCKHLERRLPTEEEWEFAARGSEGRLYPWGDAIPVEQACWNRKDGTCAVGSYAVGKSPFGLHDMAGNVWEWTSSGYSDDYSKGRDPRRMVQRGGAWNTNFSSMLRTARRNWSVPTTRVPGVGFRCAKGM